jgi:hypothetical protein
MTNHSPALSRWKHRSISVLLLAAVGSFYLWTVWQGHLVPFGTDAGLYPDLTNGFLAGQLSLKTEPRPELLALKDPYDPHQNGGLTLHDASLYKGRYYIYFGVTPVILLFLPFRALGVGNVPESTAVAIFVFGAVLFSLLTLSHIRRRFFPTIRHVSYLSYLMLGIGGSIPYFLRRPVMYEVAIACGSFCLTAAIYFVVTAVSDDAVSIWRAALGSLFIGLAVGARPHLLLASPLLALIAWKLSAQDRQQQALAPLVALFAPITLVGFALGLYNYLRFDSWIEFGHAYQLAGVDIRTLSYSLLRIPIFSYLYLWQPAHVDMAFPYTHVTRLDFPVPGQVSVEPVAGVFATTPMLYVLVLLPVLNRSMKLASRRSPGSFISTAYGWAWILLAVSLSQVLFFATFPGATMRYIVDFSLPLMTAAAIVMMGVEARLESSPWRVWAKAVFAVLVGLTVFLNASLGITGYYNNLKGGNPEAYEAIKGTTDAAIDAVVPRFYNKDLQLLSIDSQGGAVQTVGVPAFWLSRTDSQVELLAKHDGELTLRATLAIHPVHTRTGLTSVTLTARGPAGDVHTLTAGNEDTTTLVMPVRRGHNTISFRVDYDEAKAPPDDPHIILLRGLDWKLSAPAPVR